MTGGWKAMDSGFLMNGLDISGGPVSPGLKPNERQERLD